MDPRRNNLLSRRHFCLCCMTGAAFAATGGRLTPRQAFAEARGLQGQCGILVGDDVQVARQCERA